MLQAVEDTRAIRQAAAAVARASAGDDEYALMVAQRDLCYAKAAAKLRQLLTEAPPLTDDQRLSLATIVVTTQGRSHA